MAVSVWKLVGFLRIPPKSRIYAFRVIILLNFGRWLDSGIGAVLVG